MSEYIEELKTELAAVEAETQKPVEETPSVTVTSDPVAEIAAAPPVDPEVIKAAQEAFDKNPPPVVTLDPPAVENAVYSPFIHVAPLETVPVNVIASSSTSGTPLPVPSQPPCDNDHVAEGCEKFPEGFVEAKAPESTPDEPCDAPAEFPVKVAKKIWEAHPTAESIVSNLGLPAYPPDTSGEFADVKVPDPVVFDTEVPESPLLAQLTPEQKESFMQEFNDMKKNREESDKARDGKVQFWHPEGIKPSVFSDELRAFCNRWFHEDTAKFLYNQISTSHHVARLKQPQ